MNQPHKTWPLGEDHVLIFKLSYIIFNYLIPYTPLLRGVGLKVSTNIAHNFGLLFVGKGQKFQCNISMSLRAIKNNAIEN